MCIKTCLLLYRTNNRVCALDKPKSRFYVKVYYHLLLSPKEREKKTVTDVHINFSRMKKVVLWVLLSPRVFLFYFIDAY